jgi:ribosomal protein S6
MQTEKKVLDQVSDTSRIYEVGFHLVPMIPLEQVANHAAEIKALITKNGGVIISEGEAQLMDLAYEISTMIDGVKHRCNTAYFGWIKFECEAEQSLAIEKALKADKNVLRFLLVKTVRENTMIDKKLFMEEEGEESDAPVEAARAPEPVAAKEEAKEEAKPAAKAKKAEKAKASVEDMDKSIDSLLG